VRDLGKPYQVRVVVLDQHPTGNVTCTLAVRDFFGSLKWWQTIQATWPEAKPPATHGAIFGTGPNITGGHFHLHCDIPARYNNKSTGIISIWTYEEG
jgi:hypothetical protein